MQLKKLLKFRSGNAAVAVIVLFYAVLGPLNRQPTHDFITLKEWRPSMTPNDGDMVRPNSPAPMVMVPRAVMEMKWCGRYGECETFGQIFPDGTIVRFH